MLFIKAENPLKAIFVCPNCKKVVLSAYQDKCEECGVQIVWEIKPMIATYAND